MKRKLGLFTEVVLILCLGLLSFAVLNSVDLVVSDPSQLKGIRFVAKVDGIGGDHDGTVDRITGSLKINSETRKLEAGEFVVLISDISTGDKKRDCHMRESLGLSYEESDFPGDHVCTKDKVNGSTVYELPKEGKNALSFPEIKFSIIGVKTMEGEDFLFNGRSETVSMLVVWSMHGVDVEQSIETNIEALSESEYRFVGKTKLSLKEFGVVVKKFIGIGIKDQVPVSVNLVLKALN